MVPKVRPGTCIRDQAVFDVVFCSYCGILLLPRVPPCAARRSALRSSAVGLDWVRPRVVPCSDTPRLVSETGSRSHVKSTTQTLRSLSLALLARPSYVPTRMHDPSGQRVWARAPQRAALRRIRLCNPFPLLSRGRPLTLPLPFVDPNCGTRGQNSRDRAIGPHDLGAAALASGLAPPSMWASPKVRIFKVCFSVPVMGGVKRDVTGDVGGAGVTARRDRGRARGCRPPGHGRGA